MKKTAKRGKKFNPSIEEPEIVRGELKIQYSKAKKRKTGQYRIQIPMSVVDALELEKGDSFMINIPLKAKSKMSIRLRRKNGKKV